MKPSAVRVTLECPEEHQVAVLSAAALNAVLNTYGEDQRGFGARAGVAAEIVAKVADGSCPAWALSYDEFAALAHAVAALWPCALFETAAACDLLLTSVLDGDRFMATDVLTEAASRDLARALLRLAISGEPDALLPANLVALLTEQTAALAGSASPDAWVGAEILAMSLAGQS